MKEDIKTIRICVYIIMVIHGFWLGTKIGEMLF